MTKQVVCRWCKKKLSKNDRELSYGVDKKKSVVCQLCFSIFKLGYREGHEQGTAQARKDIIDTLGICGDRPIRFNPEGLR